MPGKLLLDTSVVVDYFASDAAAHRVIGAAEEVFLPAAALGELYYGVARSSRRAAHMAQVEDFLDLVTVLACDGETARHYGEIKTRCARRDGRFRRTTSGSPRRHGSTI